MLEINKVSKKVRNRILLNNISFSIDTGDICGFVGPNGSGKTTLIRALTGLINPTKGEIFVNGVNVQTNKRKALQQVGAIVESPVFFPYMSGRRNLMNLARLTEGITSENIKEKVNDVLKAVGLEGRADDKVKNYSLGMKQRLGIAQALLGDPLFIILDEPSNGLDPMGMKQLREIILELRNNQGITFLISSHFIKELEMICNSWVMIKDGSIIWNGQTQELKKGDNKNLEDMFLEMMSG
ncbi:ABC transporter ATP-binding protein [Bacillus sp. FJAT-22090]|uniref:ABC transporter ATP-binding protein n=1 Tax=Bacillus sp. FJAT-22090 TaxID=1581038 RepID=UPI0037C0CD79